MHRSNIWLVACGLFVAFTFAGCDAVEQAQNAAQRQKLMNNLKQLGIAYHSSHDLNQRGPQSWQEAEQNGLPPEVRKELEGAGYIVHWGVKMQDAMGGTSTFVTAYPPDAATAGGTVLMLDGAVIQMTAQELNDAIAKQKVDSPKAMATATGGGAASPAPDAAAAPPGSALPSGSSAPPGPPTP
jgi:hypothetical protein